MKIYKIFYNGSLVAITDDADIAKIYILSRELNLDNCNIEKIKVKKDTYYDENLLLEEWMGFVVTREEKYIISEDFLTTFHSSFNDKETKLDNMVCELKSKYDENTDEYIKKCIGKVNKAKAKFLTKHVKRFDKSLRSYIEYCLFSSNYIEDFKINNERKKSYGF